MKHVRDFVNLVCDAIRTNGPSSSVIRKKIVYAFRPAATRLRVGASNERRDGLRRQAMYHLGP